MKIESKQVCLVSDDQLMSVEEMEAWVMYFKEKAGLSREDLELIANNTPRVREEFVGGGPDDGDNL